MAAETKVNEHGHGHIETYLGTQVKDNADWRCWTSQKRLALRIHLPAAELDVSCSPRSSQFPHTLRLQSDTLMAET
jgi:hypothetical protein